MPAASETSPAIQATPSIAHVVRGYTDMEDLPRPEGLVAVHAPRDDDLKGEQHAPRDAHPWAGALLRVALGGPLATPGEP